MVEYHVDGWNLLKLNYSGGILWTEIEYGAGGEAQKFIYSVGTPQKNFVPPPPRSSKMEQPLQYCSQTPFI